MFPGPGQEQARYASDKPPFLLVHDGKTSGTRVQPIEAVPPQIDLIDEEEVEEELTDESF